MLADILIVATQDSGSDCAGQVVRMGGDEFLIIMPNASSATAQKLVQSIRTNIADLGPFNWTVRIALTEVEAGDQTLASAVERADQQLYIAKLAGRDRVAA